MITIESFLRIIKVDNKELSKVDIERLSKNDGFDSIEDFWSFFNQDYQGMIIHWTDTKY